MVVGVCTREMVVGVCTWEMVVGVCTREMVVGVCTREMVVGVCTWEMVVGVCTWEMVVGVCTWCTRLPTHSPAVIWLKMSDICHNGSSHEQDLQMESIQILQKEISRPLERGTHTTCTAHTQMYSDACVNADSAIQPLETPQHKPWVCTHVFTTAASWMDRMLTSRCGHSNTPTSQVHAIVVYLFVAWTDLDPLLSVSRRCVCQMEDDCPVEK